MQKSNEVAMAGKIPLILQSHDAVLASMEKLAFEDLAAISGGDASACDGFCASQGYGGDQYRCFICDGPHLFEIELGYDQQGCYVDGDWVYKGEHCSG